MLQWLKESWRREQRKVIGRRSSSGRRAGASFFRPRLDRMEERCLLTAGVLSTFSLDWPIMPISMAPDADGNLWIGDWGHGQSAGIDRLSVQGTLTKFPAPFVSDDGSSIFTTP